MTSSRLRLIKAPFWFAIAGFALLLTGMTARYFSFRPDINFLLVKQALVHHPIWRPVFYIHIAGGMLALLIGPFQFLKISRTKFRKLHRTIGKVYIAAILFVAAPGGFYMAFYANGGPLAELGFVIMAMLWFHMTINAYRSARAGEYIVHSRWMVRSYAMTFAAVSLRLYVPISSVVFGMRYGLVITTSAWVSWMFNLLVAELILRTDPKYRLRTRTQTDAASKISVEHSVRSSFGLAAPRS